MASPRTLSEGLCSCVLPAWRSRAEDAKLLTVGDHDALRVSQARADSITADGVRSIIWSRFGCSHRSAAPNSLAAVVDRNPMAVEKEGQIAHNSCPEWVPAWIRFEKKVLALSVERIAIDLLSSHVSLASQS